MMSNAPRLALAAGAIFSLAACERQTIEVYSAPKDQPVAEQHFPGDGHDHGPESAPAPAARPELPKFTWTLPAGWQEMPPGQMSAANFSIKGEGGEAGVTVTPLPNLGGQEEMVVNMWRQQVGQEPLSAQQVKEALSEVEVAGEKGQLFEIGGEREGKPLKIVTAMLHGKSGASWFFKISGDAALVDAQRQAFLDFVKSVKFEAGAPAPQTAAAAPAPTPAAPPAAPAPSQFPTAAPQGDLKWPVPEGWETLAPGQMQIAKFKVPEKDGASAEVAVSVFPSDTGGTLSNVNRWLGQLGKSPIQESELGSYVKPLEGGPEGAQLVTITGDDKSMLSAIVPRDGRWWFYKMTGGTAAVNAARDQFVAFAKAQP